MGVACAYSLAPDFHNYTKSTRFCANYEGVTLEMSTLLSFFGGSLTVTHLILRILSFIFPTIERSTTALLIRKLNPESNTVLLNCL